MLAKLIAVVLAVGAVGCVLLTVRQQRLQAVHDLAVIQKRVAEHDRSLWHLRIEIARQTMPERVEELARRLGHLGPLPSGAAPPPDAAPGVPLPRPTPRVAGAGTVTASGPGAGPATEIRDPLAPGGGRR